MNARKQLVVTADWDDEAGAWVAQSDDIPGLSTEAASINELVDKLKVVIPELLDANHMSDGDDIPFELISTLTAVAHRQHA